MRTTIQIAIVLFLGISLLGCNKNEKDSVKSRILYSSLNKEFVMIRNVDQLRESDDEISNHVDSILTGLINEDFISTGHKKLDLFKDSEADISFEIINLHEFNVNALPESFDSLAARAIPHTVQILDNSTYSYPDALSTGEEISESGNWTSKICVLGTFMNAGQFQGKGERFLGVRFADESGYKYGWIRIYCSQHSDTLRIIDCGYNDVVDGLITAGQTE